MGIRAWFKERRDSHRRGWAAVTHEWTRLLSPEERAVADKRTRAMAGGFKTGTEMAFQFAGWLLILSVYKYGYQHAQGAGSWALWALYWLLLIHAATYVSNLWPVMPTPPRRQDVVRGRIGRLALSGAVVWVTFILSNWISGLLGGIQFAR
jgi:hypothetical protein